MSVIHAPKSPDLDARTLALPIVSGALISLLALRLWYVQVVMAPELVEKAEATRETKIPRQAPRGLIYDRNGELIAGIKPSLAVTVVYRTVMKNEWVIPKLASMLGVEEKKLRKRISEAQRLAGLPVPVFVGAPIDVGARIAEAGDELPGVGVEYQPVRDYRDTTAYSHVLGYVGIPNDSDLDRLKTFDREPPTYVGRTGIERTHDLDLMGVLGAEHMEIDAKRRPIRLVGRDEPVPGKQLIMSIDGRLQRAALAALETKNYVGGVVAIDPKNGEVLCLVSTPKFDLGLFRNGITQTDWDQLQNDPNHPLVTRPLGASYSPGSTFKIITSLAAYESGKFDPNRVITCTGGFKLGNRVFRCMSHHGPLSFEAAFEKSCNQYFSTLGYQVGQEAMCKAAEEVGLGQRTGIDLGGESKGVVPTMDWLHRTFKKAQWYGGDTVNLSIGQGYLRATHIQMANLRCMVANNGVNYRPHLVHSFRDSATSTSEQIIEPEVMHKVTAGSEFWGPLRQAMGAVIEGSHGTGQSARIPGIIWGGKTGSTEHANAKKTHSWFVGMAPLDDPKICIAVLVEDAGHGGEVAAPVAKAVVQAYLTKLTAGKSVTNAAANAKNLSPSAVVSPAAGRLPVSR